MDTTKILAALAAARAEVLAQVRATKGAALDDASTPEQVAGASKALMALGRIDSALKVAEGKVTKAVSRMTPRKKKAKKKDAAAPEVAAPKAVDAKGKK